MQLKLLFWTICAVFIGLAAGQDAVMPTITPESYPMSAAAEPQMYWWHSPGSATFQKSLYVYAWCGLAPESNSTGTNDYIATIEATPGSANFGKVIDISNSPYSHTEAHHCGVDKTGRWLGAGGLTAFLQKEPGTDKPIPDALFWDLSDPTKPKFSHGLYTPGGACTDEFRSTRDGGFAITNMCGRTGSQGGGWFKVAPDMRSLKEYAPYNSLSAENKKTLNPHGIDVDEDADRLITSDFIDVSSTIITEMNQTPQPILQSTLRIWKYSTGRILKTIDLGKANSAGNMDARRVPTRVEERTVPGRPWVKLPPRVVKPRAQFWVTNGLGHLYHVNGITYKTTRVYCLDENCKPISNTCIQGNPFQNGTRMLLTTYALSQVRLLDISDPLKIKTLDIAQFPANAGGHVVKYDEATGIAAVSTYFLDIKGTVLRYNADQKVSFFFVNLKTDKLELLGAVDFTDAIASKGASSCHGLAFNSYYEY